jgi:hypothetical protein
VNTGGLSFGFPFSPDMFVVTKPPRDPVDGILFLASLRKVPRILYELERVGHRQKVERLGLEINFGLRCADEGVWVGFCCDRFEPRRVRSTQQARAQVEDRGNGDQGEGLVLGVFGHDLGRDNGTDRNANRLSRFSG